MRALALAIASALLLAGTAGAQQVNTATAVVSPSTKSTGEYLSEGYEVKGVVNNTYLILQKGNQALLCGSRDPSLTWANWAAQTRTAPCEPLSK